MPVASGFDDSQPLPAPAIMSRMYGAQLFTSSSASSGVSIGFNPSYAISQGDQIQIRLWGAFNFDGVLSVDPQGNIFLPNVGPLKVMGIANSQLNALVTSKVKQVYQTNVNVYASLLQAQPVKVFVTGYVNNPGLYGGVASDSLLSYLSKAGGVDSERGSYVDIVVKRSNRIRSRINLYDFLLKGNLSLSQFADGDTIVVGPRQHTFSVDGDVYNSYDFEFRDSAIAVTEALSWARAKPGATHLTIVREQGTMKRSEYFPLDKAAGRMLQDGDRLIVSSDRYTGTIQVRVEERILASTLSCCPTVQRCARCSIRSAPTACHKLTPFGFIANLSPCVRKRCWTFHCKNWKKPRFLLSLLPRMKPSYGCRKPSWSAVLWRKPVS